jgi:HEAT repeat protein
MAKRRTTDDLLAALNRLADPASAEAGKELCNALAKGHGLVAARAAEIIRENELQGYEAELAAAFDRFLDDDPVAADPQCRAKTAIVETLGSLGYRDSEFFLRHIGYRQFEPVWGGSADTAGHLRGLCGYGLVQSDHRRPLTYLIDLLADPEKVTRQGAAQALALTGREEAALVLRMKLLCGDKEYEVVGECFAALLSLTPAEGVPFVARFLGAKDETVRLEAAAALGSSARPEAAVVLIERWKVERDDSFREPLLIAIGAARRPEAIDFLLSLVSSGSVRVASQALAALAPCRFYPDLKARIGETIRARNDAGLSKQFAKEFEER